MIAKFTVGMCILMHGSYYKIMDVGNGVYNLEQTMTVFEQDRSFRENWKISYIDQEAHEILSSYEKRHYKCQ